MLARHRLAEVPALPDLAAEHHDGVESGLVLDPFYANGETFEVEPNVVLYVYDGKYSDPFYGSVNVAVADGKLRATFNDQLSADLGHWQFDTFMGTWNKPWWDQSLFTFQLSPISADVQSLTVDGATLRKEPKAAAGN